MDAIKAAITGALVVAHNDYEQSFALRAADSSPQKKQWIESLDASPFVSAASELGDDLVGAAQDTEDPAEILALLNRVDEIRAVIKEWLSNAFWQATRQEAPAEGVPTPEELKVKLDRVRTAFDAAMSMVTLGHMTQDDIKEALTFEKEGETVVRWQMRGTRGSDIFTYKPVGTVHVKQGEGQAGIRANTTKARLVVDGVMSEDRLLGDACRKVGISVVDLNKEVVRVHGKNAWMNRATTNKDDLVTMNGHVLGLRYL